MFDLVIIGAGPAGLSAAVYGQRAGLNCLLLESSMYGGQITQTPEVENYPSLKKIAGWELAQNMYEQATELGAQLAFETVTALRDNGAVKTVVTTENEFEAKAVIIANGAKRRTLNCEGEEELAGAGVSYCAYCDGAFFKDKAAVVVGGGNTALEDALYLANICKSVMLVHRRNEYRAEKHLVELVNNRVNIIQKLGFVPVKITGENAVDGIVLKNAESGEEETVAADCVFVCIGLAPENNVFADTVALDEAGYIAAGEDCKTSCSGIFAAGDTRTKALRQIVTAAADGAVAAAGAASYINSL